MNVFLGHSLLFGKFHLEYSYKGVYKFIIKVGLSLSRLSLHLELMSLSLYGHSRLFSLLYLELSLYRFSLLVPCEVDIEKETGITIFLCKNLCPNSAKVAIW